MKDYAEYINKKGIEKENEEEKKKEAKVREIERLIDEILEQAGTMETLIKNANALIDNGLVWKSGAYETNGFTKNNFYSDRINHRLGFTNNFGNAPIHELSVLGGGYNGDISIRFNDALMQICNEKGTKCYSMKELKNNERLCNCAIHHLKRFNEDLPLFEKAFEDYILSL